MFLDWITTTIYKVRFKQNINYQICNEILNNLSVVNVINCEVKLISEWFVYERRQS